MVDESVSKNTEEGNVSRSDFTETHSQDTMRNFKRATDVDDNQDLTKINLRIVSQADSEHPEILEMSSPSYANGYLNLAHDERIDTAANLKMLSGGINRSTSDNQIF